MEALSGFGRGRVHSDFAAPNVYSSLVPFESRDSKFLLRQLVMRAPAEARDFPLDIDWTTCSAFGMLLDLKKCSLVGSHAMHWRKHAAHPVGPQVEQVQPSWTHSVRTSGQLAVIGIASSQDCAERSC
jgi:hypothetical protein